MALATSLVACFDDSDNGDDVDGGYVQPGADAGGPYGGEGAKGRGPFAKQPSRGAAVALSESETISVVVNRDVGSATVLRVNYAQGQTTTTEPIAEVQLGAKSEPWQVVIAPDNETAFVVLRRDQKLVRIKNLSTKPEVDGAVAVGSEPTSLALSPSGARAYVTNWANGDISVVDTHELAVVSTIDLNAPLVKTGYLGSVTPRPALAHPRSITVSNDGDEDDSDESLFVTEYFAQQIAPLKEDGSNADVNRAGIVYQIRAADHSVSTMTLSPLENIGFKDSAGNFAGCFPNQLQSITLNGDLAYVVSVCAAPEGPEGLKVTTQACTTVADCSGLNLVDPVCDVVAGGNGKGPVCQDVASLHTATSPVVSVIDTKQGREIPGAAQNLTARFDAFFDAQKIPDGQKRFPHFSDDLAFVPGTGVAYVTANAIDAVFRLVYDVKTGQLTEVGASTSPFINLTPTGIDPDKAGKGPIGIAIGAANKKFAIVAADITRNALVVDFNTQAIAGGVQSPSVTRTAALPPKGSDEERILLGRDLFNTARARWSLFGEGWGACQSCHSDGLTDNVTWFFGRGPRQSTSLDGSFASKDPLDQRVLNHTTNRDEFADFDNNVRATSGGVGAIVFLKSVPPVNSDRIDTNGLLISELNGSSLQASDPANPLRLGFDAAGNIAVGALTNATAKPAGSQLEDWIAITRYAQTIRSPRAPTNLDSSKVQAGEQLFTKYGSCQGCHGGAKWTVSKLFYEPSIATMQALRATNFQVPQGFPSALLPAQDPLDQRLVINAGGDSVQCVVRNVGTFNVAEPGIGIAEVRGTNMVDLAQGGGNVVRPNADGDNNPANDARAMIGYNVPSLLGVVTGAPYLHAGNARTLEALLSDPFGKHTRALAPNFLLESDPKVVQQQVESLVQYLLSIDEDKPVIDLPPPGAQGGALCPDKFVPSAPARY